MLKGAPADVSERVEILEQRRTDEDRHAAEKHDPCGVGPRRQRHRIFLLQDRAERPARRGSEHEERAERRLANRRVAVADEEREPRHAE